MKMTLSPIQPNYVSTQEFGVFKGEMYEFRDEMYQFKKEVKNEFTEFRKEVNSSLLQFRIEIGDDINRHMGQIYEKSQHDLGLALELLKDARNNRSESR